jgi:hypothetical protein
MMRIVFFCFFISVSTILSVDAQEQRHIGYQEFALMKPAQQKEFVQRIRKIIFHQELLVNKARFLYRENPKQVNLDYYLKQKTILKNLRKLWGALVMPEAHANPFSRVVSLFSGSRRQTPVPDDDPEVIENAFTQFILENSEGPSGSCANGAVNHPHCNACPVEPQPRECHVMTEEEEIAQLREYQREQELRRAAREAELRRQAEAEAEAARQAQTVTYDSAVDDRVPAGQAVDELSEYEQNVYREFFENIPDEMRCTYGGWPSLRFVVHRDNGQVRTFCASPQQLADPARMEMVRRLARELNEQGVANIDVDALNDEKGNHLAQLYQQRTENLNCRADLEGQSLVLACNPDIYGDMGADNCVFTQSDAAGNNSVDGFSDADWGQHHALICWKRAMDHEENIPQLVDTIIEQGPNSPFIWMSQEIYNMCVCDYGVDQVHTWSDAENQNANIQNQLFAITMSLSSDCMALMDLSRRVLDGLLDQADQDSCLCDVKLQYEEEPPVALYDAARTVRDRYTERLQQRATAVENNCQDENVDQLLNCIHGTAIANTSTGGTGMFTESSSNIAAHEQYIRQAHAEGVCPLRFDHSYEVERPEDDPEPILCEEMVTAYNEHSEPETLNYTVDAEGNISCNEGELNQDECTCPEPSTEDETCGEPSDQDNWILDDQGVPECRDDGYVFQDYPTCQCQESSAYVCQDSDDNDWNIVDGEYVCDDENKTFNDDPDSCSCEGDEGAPETQDDPTCTESDDDDWTYQNGEYSCDDENFTFDIDLCVCVERVNEDDPTDEPEDDPAEEDDPEEVEAFEPGQVPQLPFQPQQIPNMPRQLLRGIR